MISSSNKGILKITAYLPIGRSPKSAGKEAPHEAFANVGDTPAAWETFRKLWGPLIVAADPEFLPIDARLGFQDNLQAAWREDEKALAVFHQSEIPVIIKPTKRRIEIEPTELLHTINLLFLRDFWAGKIGICANKDCPNPYYIKKRKTQKYCEAGPCTGEAQRQQKLDWWNRVGKKRAKKTAKKGRTA